jgi:hypothetical protein
MLWSREQGNKWWDTEALSACSKGVPWESVNKNNYANNKINQSSLSQMFKVFQLLLFTCIEN